MDVFIFNLNLFLTLKNLVRRNFFFSQIFLKKKKSLKIKPITKIAETKKKQKLNFQIEEKKQIFQFLNKKKNGEKSKIGN
jgi:hypothetical protein